jgi:hypothetical protein
MERMTFAHRWPSVAEAMPTGKWRVRVLKDETVVSEHLIPFADTIASQGLLIGNAEPVHIMVPRAEEMPATRIQVIAAGAHAFAALLEGVSRSFENPPLSGFMRFDWNYLDVAGYKVDIYFKTE